jgi:putative flippase GtrA
MAGILSLWQRRGVRQLVKFCLVGASSAVVDNATKWVLLKNFPTLPWWMAATVAFGFGLTNGFFWNRHITFRARNYGNAKKQYIKFAITNSIGLLLNLTITKMFLMLLTRQVVHGQNPEAHIVIYASLMALPFVAIWNFSAAKYWTFREPKSAPPAATALSAVATEPQGQ